jgi:hypothetical protein
MFRMKSAETTSQTQAQKRAGSRRSGVRFDVAVLDGLETARGLFMVDQMLTCRKSLAGQRGSR